MSEIIKQKGGKDYTVMEAINEFLDDEVETIQQKIDKSQLKSISQMKIKMISEEIIILEATEPMLLVGIAELDNIHYGAIFIINTRQCAIEELHMNKTLTEVKSSRLIEDPTEWAVISKFFQDAHIFEMARIMNWAIACKTKDQLSLHKNINRLPWIDKVNHDLKAKHKKPLTTEEIARSAIRNQWPHSGDFGYRKPRSRRRR